MVEPYLPLEEQGVEEEDPDGDDQYPVRVVKTLDREESDHLKPSDFDPLTSVSRPDQPHELPLMMSVPEMGLARGAHFLKTIQPGDRDPVVVQYKRILHYWDPKVYRLTKFTPLAGDHFCDAVQIFRHRKGLTEGRALGINTHIRLMYARRRGLPSVYAADKYSIFKLNQRYEEATLSPLERKVETGLSYARLLVSNGLWISYHQDRPMGLYLPPRYDRTGDCSDSCTKIYFAALLPDPNGRGYDGQGYTGTLVSRGRTIALDKIQPLDLIFYGYTNHPSPAFPVGAPTHVAMSMGSYKLDRIFTFGSEPGPEWENIHYRGDVRYARRYIDDL